MLGGLLWREIFSQFLNCTYQVRDVSNHRFSTGEGPPPHPRGLTGSLSRPCEEHNNRNVVAPTTTLLDDFGNNTPDGPIRARTRPAVALPVTLSISTLSEGGSLRVMSRNTSAFSCDVVNDFGMFDEKADVELHTGRCRRGNEIVIKCKSRRMKFPRHGKCYHEKE